MIGISPGLLLRCRPSAPWRYPRSEPIAGDYNLRGRTPTADVDVCFNGNNRRLPSQIIVARIREASGYFRSLDEAYVESED